MMNFGYNEGPAEGFDSHVDNLRGTMFYVCQVRYFIFVIKSNDPH